MKNFITIIVGLIVFCFVIGKANDLIHYITSGIQNHDLHLVVVIALWVICGSTILALAFWIGIVVSSLIAILFSSKPKRKI